MTDPLHNEFPPNSLEAKDLAHLLHPVTNLKQHHEVGPAVHVRAKGVYLWDNRGKQYLEGMAGLWCTALGYGEEELVKTATEQLMKLSYSPLFGGTTNSASRVQHVDELGDVGERRLAVRCADAHHVALLERSSRHPGTTRGEDPPDDLMNSAVSRRWQDTEDGEARIVRHDPATREKLVLDVRDHFDCSLDMNPIARPARCRE